MAYSFLKRVENTIYFDGVAMEIYISKDYFKDGTAEFQGDKISTLGIFDFIVYPDQDRKAKGSELHSLGLPMNVIFEFKDYFETDNIQGKYPGSYYVFILDKGCIFVENVIKEQSATNAKNFIFKFHSGKLSKNLKYEDIIDVYTSCVDLNNVKLNNASAMFEMNIAELARSKNDEKIPFRKAINANPNLTQLDYKLINIKQLPNINSTFASMMFENIDQSIHYSLLKTKNHEKEVESPLEKIIKY